MISKMEIRFSSTPARIMSSTFICPQPNTSALDGVATGSIKAQEAAMAAADISRKGRVSTARAKGASKGKMTAVVAVLEVISVRKFTAATRLRIIASRYIQ